jgi:serine/threonine protein kinase
MLCCIGSWPSAGPSDNLVMFASSQSRPLVDALVMHKRLRSAILSTIIDTGVDGYSGLGFAVQLSPECMDLLNRVFVLDEKMRISIDGLKSHPWTTKPLLPRYQAALDHLREEQKKVDDYIAHRRVSEVKHSFIAAFAGPTWISR